MFTRREPREVYRVYGEEELFADDQPSLEPDPMVAPAEPVAAHDPASVFSPEYAASPEPFMAAAAAETLAPPHPAAPHLAPTGDELRQAPESWEPPRPRAGADPYGSLPPRSPLIATQPSSGGPTVLIAVLAVIIGLIVGLLAVSALRSGGGQHAPVAPSQPQPRSSHVATPAAVQTVQPVAVKAPTPHRAPRATRTNAHARARRQAHGAHPVHRPAVVLRRAESGPAPPASRPSPVPTVLAPSAAVSPPAVRYVPPSSSSSGGMEFGFEH